MELYRNRFTQKSKLMDIKKQQDIDGVMRGQVHSPPTKRIRIFQLRSFPLQ